MGDASDDNDGDSGSDFEISESSSDSDFEQERGDSTEEEMELEYGKKKKSRSKGDGGRRRSNRERRVLYDDMDDFVVSGSDDSDESYTKRKAKGIQEVIKMIHGIQMLPPMKITVKENQSKKQSLLATKNRATDQNRNRNPESIRTIPT